jgi:hypothetical protein
MNSSDKKIRAMFILEILGKPKEYLTETLEKIIEEIGKEKGIKIIGKKINPPELIKDQDQFYTTFAEVEIEADNILLISILMFKYMPAHIEIVSPQNISLTNSDFEEVLNELTRRLHGYEEIVRIMQNERLILQNKLKEPEPKNPKEEKKTKRKK